MRFHAGTVRIALLSCALALAGVFSLGTRGLAAEELGEEIARAFDRQLENGATTGVIEESGGMEEAEFSRFADIIDIAEAAEVPEDAGSTEVVEVTEAAEVVEAEAEVEQGLDVTEFAAEEVVESTAAAGLADMRSSSCVAAVYAEPACCEPAPARSWTIGAFVGGGDQNSMAYELFVKKSFNSWWSGQWGAVTPILRLSGFVWDKSGDTLGGGSLAGGLDIDFGRSDKFRPFVEGTFGGALISQTTFGDKNYSTAFQFRSQAGIGFKFGPELRHTLQADFVHYSNACIKRPNDGHNTIGGSYGLSF